MISYSEALSRIREVALEKQNLFLQENQSISIEPEVAQRAIGRILAEAIVSREAIPPFHNSSMDGFAVHSEVTMNASEITPVKISVRGIVYAGQVFDEKLLAVERSSHLTSIEIMTGAPLPRGFDSVVKIEDVKVTRGLDGQAESILLTTPLQPGENVRKKGTDFSIGQKLLSQGATISAEHILGFATIGYGEIRVQRRPRVALLSTGNELTDQISDSLEAGMIRNATAPYLMSALPFFGADGKYYGTVKDDPVSFQNKITEILKDKPDVILTTGAVSKGKLDFVPGALAALGAAKIFHGVYIRPGKPLLFAQFQNGPAVFAVPGNPISTAVALRFFVSPYLRRLQNLPDEAEASIVLSEDTEKAEGLRCFWKTSVHAHGTVASGTGTHAKSMKGQESYRVSSLLPANAWMILPEAGNVVSAGSLVQILPLYPVIQFTDLETENGDCC
jgi:molybdopterin molybdotransferase